MKILSILIFLVLDCLSLSSASSFKTISFTSKDGLQVTADLYLAHPTEAPFIVLFHQAGASRGEYRMIAPELNAFGFNAMAVDQRIGNSFNAITNETAKRYGTEGMSEAYIDALPDMEAAIKYARKNYAKGKLIIWGSSYSASLVLKIAGDNPNLADGVLAFSPGEYFANLGKGPAYIVKAQEISGFRFLSHLLTMKRTNGIRFTSLFQEKGKPTFCRGPVAPMVPALFLSIMPPARIIGRPSRISLYISCALRLRALTCP